VDVHYRHLAKLIFGSAFLAATIAAVVIWARYPKAPDPNTVDLHQAVQFVAAADFNRMYHWDQRRYALAIVARLKDKSFADLVKLQADRSIGLREALQNIGAMPDADEITAGVATIFLEKFYELSKTQRDVYLTLFLLRQKLDPAKRPPKIGMPEAARFRACPQAEMARLLKYQTPRAAAQMGQFLVDERQKRKMLGIPDPF
jgi:hypothetical protein